MNTEETRIETEAKILRAQWFGTLLALALFATSCCLTAGHGHGGFLEDGFDPKGWNLLLLGLMAMWFDLTSFAAWMANPLAAIVTISLWYGHLRPVVILAIISYSLSLIPFVYLMSAGIDEVRLTPPIAVVSSGGNIELRIGYFLWVGSHCSLLLTAMYAWRYERILGIK